MPRVLSCLLLLASACTTVRPILVAPARDSKPAATTLFSGVRVFDGLGDSLSAPLDVLVKDGRIAALGPPGSLDRAGAELIDGAGKTLLPGLIDCHVHLGAGDGTPPWDSDVPNTDAQSAALVYSGVTTILPGLRDSDWPELMQRIAAGELAGPRIFPTSRAFTAPGGHPVPFLKALLPWPINRIIISQRVRQVATPDEARAAADEEIAQGAKFVKAMYDAIPPSAPHLTLEVLDALSAEVRAKGARLIVHVSAPDDAVAAAEAGAALLMHTPWQARLTDAQVARLKATGIPLVTTARVPDVMMEGAAGVPKLSPLEEEVMPPKLPESYAKKPKDYQLPGFGDDFIALLPGFRETLAFNLRALDAAGVPLLVGTDSGLPLMLHGPAVHRELARLVEIGFSPAHVLRMATSQAAKFLDANADFGSIEQGKRADLLLIEGDPLADITTTEHIVGVWQDGRRLERKPAR